MASKISPVGIIRDHLATLKSFDTGRYSLVDLLLFWVLPALVAGFLVWSRVKLTDSVVNVLITALSVFAGLLFNLLLLIYDIVQRARGNQGESSLQKKFLKEIYANISFCIFISIVAIMILLISALRLSWQYIETVLSAITYYILAAFVLTLLMVLKRVHVLLSREFGARD